MASSNYARLREQTMGSHEDEEAVTVNTRALIDKVLARYSGEWTTLRELIQNAADAQASKVTIRFETTPSSTVPLPSTQNPGEHLKHVLLHHTVKTLLVTNDGAHFNENDWQRLKRIAEGNPDETKIGAFGVGFYSVFADCETPFVSSGNQTMAFYWKKDSLFTRRGKLPEEQATKGTTFLLDYRSQSTPVPQLLGLCQFLATSLTFVGLECIDLYLDDSNVLKLTKKIAPGVKVNIPKEVNPKTRDGLMKITDVEYQNAQIDAQWMNVVGWNRTIPQPTNAIPLSQNDSSSGSLRGWFAKLTSGGPTTSVASQKARKEEEALQRALIEDLAGFSTASVFLRISTVSVSTFVSKQLSQELERATKKPPPKHTRIAILTSSYDESSASLSTISGAGSKKAGDIFSSVLPSKNGKIFIGFPTAQTTGLLAHISAPSVIPTVERESIDLNARYVRDWNVEMLRVAGIACRIAYTGEMAELKAKLERTMAGSGNKKVTKEDLAAVMPSAIHLYKQYHYEESTPSMKVGEYIEEAFWMCNQKASIDVLSTRGILPSQQVRVATEDLSFVEGIPVVPDELMDKANEFLTKLRDYGLLSDITTGDIKKELEAQALTEKQVSELVKWACMKVGRSDFDASVVQSLFDGTVAGINEEFVKLSSSPIVQLGEIKSFVNVAKIPAEMPTPPSTIPFRMTKGLAPAALQSIGWEELQIVPWLRWIIESDGQGFGAGQSLTTTPAVATQVLPVISKSWEGLSQSSKQTVVELLAPRTVVPTKLGMRKPPQAYFASVKLFEDLPTITGLQGVKEKFLAALGVRKTVELNVVFDRLMAKSATPATEDGKWSHVDLIKYLVSVKDDIPDEDVKRLRNTPICTAEIQSADQANKGKLYRVSELFEPSEAIRQLGLPVLHWPGPYRANSPEGRFLKMLGLQPYPSVQDLVNILSKAPMNSELQKSAFNYWVITNYQNGYHKFPVATIDKAFLPVQPFAGESNNLVAKPSQCYANPKASVLRFRILREDLQAHHAVFGVAMDPPIESCAERLIKQPPLDVKQAKVLFSYFAGRLNEIGPNGNLAEKLGDAPIVPIVDRSGSEKMSNVRFVSPRTCFIGDGQSYGDIFDFVDFDGDANNFLLRVGSKHEPSAAEIAGMLVRQPARLLQTLGHEKYLQILRKIAENATNLKRDKELWRQLKTSPCLLAEKQVAKSVPGDSERVRDAEDEEMMIKEYSLAAAPGMVLLDDFATYRLFQSGLLVAPQEEVLEDLYSALETPWLSRLVEDDQRMGQLLKDQSSAQKLQKLIIERCRLFLYDHTLDVIRHDAKWLEQNMTVKATEYLQVTRRLKGYRMQFVEKRTAALHRESKRDAVLYITTRYDLYEVSRAIMSLLLKKPRQQDYLALEILMESDLRRLKTKGYNVDRILRQKAEESRIAESERVKREEEQRRLAEEEAKLRAQSQAQQPQAMLTNGTSSQQEQPQQQQQQQQQQLPAPDTPDRQLSMPGAFNESPPMTSRGKKPSIFSNLSKHLGINQHNTSSQQMQNLLTNGEDAPPPYEPRDPNGRAIAPGTEQVTSPRDLHQNLESAVKASRPHNSSSLFSPPDTKTIKETPSYCDNKPGHDLTQVADLNNGIKLFLSRAHPDPNQFLQTNKDAIATFVWILAEVASIFDLPTSTLNIFHDETGAAIAFNNNGSLFCNLRYFMQLHLAQMDSPEGKVEAMAYWWITICHELAHNLVREHNSQHSFYTESFVAQYFRRMVWWASRVGTTGSVGGLDGPRPSLSPTIPFNILNSGSSNTRKPANIPLHTLTSSSRQRRHSSESFDEKDGDRERLRRSGSDFEGDEEEGEGSEFSLWSDTGDLVDQLAAEEDPLAPQRKGSFEERRRGRSSQKRVRYASANGHRSEEKGHRPHQQAGVVKRKEEIFIPTPPPSRLSWGEKVLAAVIMPGDGHARMHGLHGKKLIYFLSIFVSLGVFLFGYDQGVMSGIITGPHFRDYFNQPSAAEIGTMVAILEVGAFISSLSVGRMGDLLGRRKTILYGAVIFVVGGACQAFATGMPMMMLGRIIAGLGVGALSTIVPVYQSEISPPHNRGKLACIEFSGNIFGYMCSVWMDYFCSYIKSDWAWRLPLLMQVVMGGLLAVGSFLIVESPRWLLDNDHDEEGIVVIANLYGKGDIHNSKARDEYREIKMNVLLQRQEGERSYRDMFKRYYKRVFIAMSAQALAQLNGINVISYYAPLVFEQAGWTGRDAILMTGINGISYLASTIPPWYVVDRLGRRFILLSGAVAMIISLSAISYFIYIDIALTPNMVVIFVMIYNAAFGYSWGPIPWLYPPEILPLSIRAKGASLSTAANWAFNWLVGEMTPILQEVIKWRLYLLHAFFCAVSFVVVYFIYPETANVRLEDMNSIFGDASTAAPTPATLAEAESLFSGNRSPVPSFSLGNDDNDDVPDEGDLQPPEVEVQNGKPVLSKNDSESQTGSLREGVGGWISNLVKRGENGGGATGGGRYRRVGQEEGE